MTPSDWLGMTAAIVAGAATGLLLVQTSRWGKGFFRRRHARQLQERLARGHDRHFEELRALDAYSPDRFPAISQYEQTLMAMVGGAALAAYVYLYSFGLMSNRKLQLLGFALVAGVWSFRWIRSWGTPQAGSSGPSRYDGGTPKDE